MQRRRPFGSYVALVFVTVFASIAQAQTNAAAHSSPALTALPQADLGINQWKEQEFLAFDPRFKEEMAGRVARARALGKQVITREIAGQNTEFAD